MSNFDERRSTDLARLEDLERRSNRRIVVTGSSGNPISQIWLCFNVRTPSGPRYPQEAVGAVDAIIYLDSGYPFNEPAVSLQTRVFNPNVFVDGRVCIGKKWMVTEYLDLLAERLFKLLTFNELIVNPRSAANPEAARWYERAMAARPDLFPTEPPLGQSAPRAGMRFRD